MSEPSAATQVRVRVRCLVSRMVGDGVFGAGSEYVLPASVAARYAALGYFLVLGPVPVVPDPEPEPDAKQMAAPPNKRRRLPQTKGQA